MVQMQIEYSIMDSDEIERTVEDDPIFTESGFQAPQWSLAMGHQLERQGIGQTKPTDAVRLLRPMTLRRTIHGTRRSACNSLVGLKRVNAAGSRSYTQCLIIAPLHREPDLADNDSDNCLPLEPPTQIYDLRCTTLSGLRVFSVLFFCAFCFFALKLADIYVSLLEIAFSIKLVFLNFWSVKLAKKCHLAQQGRKYYTFCSAGLNFGVLDPAKKRNPSNYRGFWMLKPETSFLGFLNSGNPSNYRGF